MSAKHDSELIRLDERLFEERLLRAGRSEAPPSDLTEQAWLKFAGQLGAIASLNTIHNPTDPERSMNAASVADAPSVTLGINLKSLLYGALGGSAVTLALVAYNPLATVPSAPQPAQPTASALMTTAPSNLVNPVASASGAAPIITDERRPSLPRAVHGNDSAPAPRAMKSDDTARMRAKVSTLAAEIAALDAVRTAIAIGNFNEAQRLVQRYHRDFPRGALSIEAEVLAIEAFAAAGQADQTKRAAQAFLARRPNAPHAARVRSLAQSVNAP